MDAYCDEKLKQCVCRDPEDKGNSNDEMTEQEESTEKPESGEEDAEVSAVTGMFPLRVDVPLQKE